MLLICSLFCIDVSGVRMMKRAFSALYEVEDESDDDVNEANKM